MKRDSDNKWLDSLLADVMYREPAAFDSQKWAHKHPDAAKLLESGFVDSEKRYETNTYHVWRLLMESKVTRYSAAAVVALAAALVLLSPFGTSDHTGVVLADVQKRIAETDTMVFRGQKIFSLADDPNISFKFDVVKYMSKAYGHTEEGYLGGKLAYRLTFNLPKRQGLVAMAMWKKCLIFPCTEQQLRIVEKLHPNGLIDLFLQTDFEVLGPGNIDGVEVEGFELQNLKPLDGILGILPKALFDLQADKSKAQIWVGVKELLPIKMEGDIVIGKSLFTAFTELRLHEFCVLEKYNIELDEKIFSTDIPEGYTEIKITDFIPIKAGLAGVGLGAVPIGLVVSKKLRKSKTVRPVGSV